MVGLLDGRDIEGTDFFCFFTIFLLMRMTIGYEHHVKGDSDVEEEKENGNNSSLSIASLIKQLQIYILGSVS